MKLVILSPCGVMIDHEHLACLQKVKEVDILRTYGATVIEQARAVLATKALETSADVFLWIDSDIIFNPSDAVAMSERCAAGDYAILGASYSKRGPGVGMVGTFKQRQEKVKFFRPGILEANTLGLGFTAVRREVFERLADTLPKVRLPSEGGMSVWPFFLSTVDDGVYLAEDSSFCVRASKAGFRIGMDLEPRVYHKGTYKYALEDVGAQVPYCEELDAEFSDPPAQEA